MENIILKQIKDGDTGNIAAKKIFWNDEKLKEAIDEIRGQIDIAQVTLSGGTIVGLATGPGTDEGSDLRVMTQKAVTEFVEREGANDCLIGQTITTGIQMPNACEEYPGLWATRASQNAQGNSLTTLYNDVQDLKNLYGVINDITDVLDNMNARISAIESRLDDLQ